MYYNCTIIFKCCSHAKGLRHTSYDRIPNHMYPAMRALLVLNCEPQDRRTLEKALANDLHLLFDVFWLEEVKIHSEVSNLNMNAIYDVVRIRNYSRSLLSFEQHLEEKKLDALK